MSSDKNLQQKDLHDALQKAVRSLVIVVSGGFALYDDGPEGDEIFLFETGC
jgi:hypothetical protein